MSPLSGPLADFAVDEVLGLVARKPGQWVIRLDAERRGFIGVRDGAVVSASEDDSQHALARRLIVDGAAGTTSMSESLPSSGDAGVLDALVRADAIDPERVGPVTRRHLASVLAALSRWRQGTFTAERAASLPDDVGVGVPLRELVPLVTAVIKRWRTSADALGGLGTVMATHPGEVPPPLRGLHSLIDGRRTVAQLVEASGHGSVGTVVDLGELVDAGSAAPLAAGTPAPRQRLATPSTEQDLPATAEWPRGPHVSVIPGGVSAETPVTDGSTEEDDLLAVILRGVRGV